MLFKKKKPVRPLNLILSILFLTFCLSLLFYVKGEPEYSNAYLDLANLKSMVELESFRRYNEPLSGIILYYWKTISHLDYLLAYQIYLSVLYSVFLHLCMYIFQKGEWKPNHYSSLYLLGLSPLSINIPYEYSSELLCLVIILFLYLYERLGNFIDLIVMAILTILGFLSNFVMFLIVFSVYLTVYCIKEMRYVKTTLFYKKRNIPLIVLIVYGFCLVALVFALDYFSFFGNNSFTYLFTKAKDIFFQFFPIILLILFINLLLEKEKELNNKISYIVVAVFILVSTYFSYQYRGKVNIEKIIRQGQKLSSLKGDVIRQNQRIYGSSIYSDVIYFHFSEKIASNNISKMEKDDFLIVNGLDKETAIRANKKIKTKGSLFITLDSDSVLINKKFMQKVFSSGESSSVKKRLLKSIGDFYQPTPYDKMKKILTNAIPLPILNSES